MAPSEPSSPTTGNPAYSITSEKQELDLKSHLILLMEDFKDINNSLKEIQENIGQQVEALKEETQKSLKETQENMGQQVEALKEETQKFLKEFQEKNKQTSEGTEQNYPGSKTGNRINKEITK